MKPDKFRLYCFVPSIIKDAWGWDISVLRLVDTVIVSIIGKREYDNGYEKVMIDVASDGKRTFYKPVQIDYFGGGTWYEDNVAKIIAWYTSARMPKERYIDAAENPFTKEMLIEQEKSWGLN